MIEISKIGEGQLVDVEKSKLEWHNNYSRSCTVLQGSPPKSDIGDTTPFRIAKLYGSTPEHWNRQLVIQAAKCPFNCWYCYVDNLKVDRVMSIRNIVEEFKLARSVVPDLNVLHFMGGAPARYSSRWIELRRQMDKGGLGDTILLSDVILVENWVYNQKPWENIPERTLINVDLKGSDFKEFKDNTGVNMFAQALWELPHYFGNPQVHYSATNCKEENKPYIESLLGYKVDWIKVKYYEVVKRRGYAPSNPR